MADLMILNKELEKSFGLWYATFSDVQTHQRIQRLVVHFKRRTGTIFPNLFSTSFSTSSYEIYRFSKLWKLHLCDNFKRLAAYKFPCTSFT